MRIARYTTGEDPTFGVVEEDDGQLVLLEVQGDPLHQPVTPTGNRVALEDVRLLAPVIPRSKVIGIGKNYADHAAEMGGEAPAEPLMFLKPNTSVIGPGDPIVLPRQSSNVHYEGELAVVISRICKDVPLERVADVIYGYTCANDVTARDLQKSDGQWARAKGFDTFCPLGPWIVTDLDPGDLAITTRRDGETVQDGRTSQMVRDIGVAHRARLGSVHAAARRRDPDRHAGRRGPDRGRPARRGRGRGHRHAVQPGRQPGLTASRVSQYGAVPGRECRSARSPRTARVRRASRSTGRRASGWSAG